jgi:hypothetical protein
LLRSPRSFPWLLRTLIGGGISGAASLDINAVTFGRGGTSEPLEAASLAGAIVAIIAVWVPRDDAVVNLGVIFLIVAGYSAVTALNQKTRPPQD